MQPLVITGYLPFITARNGIDFKLELRTNGCSKIDSGHTAGFPIKFCI